MPGRQSTGPAIVQTSHKRKRQTKARDLNAFSIAEQQYPDQVNERSNRFGQLEGESIKRRRNEDDGSEEEKRNKSSQKTKLDRDRHGNNLERGSDSEGNEWIIGQVPEEDDSELDSDEAMGESDEEKFRRFSFRTSSSKAKAKKSVQRASEMSKDINMNSIDLNEEDSENGLANEEEDSGDKNNESDESDAFKEAAIDLDAMLEGSDDGSDNSEESSGSDDSDAQSQSSEDPDSVLSLSDDDANDINDTKRMSALQAFITNMADGSGEKDDFSAAQEAMTPSDYGLSSRKKVTIQDLLPTISDPRLKKSLKLMADDGKSKLNGIPQKLEVPLPKRQQDRLDRAAAYEKSKETLNRWIDTIKHNRRAEHLSFPLPDPEATAAQDTSRLLPTTQAKPITDLEITIQNILIESGLAPANGQAEEDRIQAFEELATNKMPFEEVQARRAELRKARELLFREEIRSKRIKKIKSKSYRRVHRRERERNLLRDQEALVAAGVEPSEDEQERRERRRAEERMGARHRESKWAKAMKTTGRATWDDEARNGVNEMARREEELKRRIQGKDIAATDDDSHSSDTDSAAADDEFETDDQRAKRRLSSRLGRLSAGRQDLASTATRLSSHKFMQTAEAARKAQNDAAIETIRKELAGEDSSASDASNIAGRRTYQPAIGRQGATAADERRNEFEEPVDSEDNDDDANAGTGKEPVEKAVVVNSSNQPTQHPPHRRALSSVRSTENTTKEDSLVVEDNPWLTIPAKRHAKRSKASVRDDSVLIITNPEDIPPIEGRLDSVQSRQRSSAIKSTAELGLGSGLKSISTSTWKSSTTPTGKASFKATFNSESKLMSTSFSTSASKFNTNTKSNIIPPSSSSTNVANHIRSSSPASSFDGFSASASPSPSPSSTRAPTNAELIARAFADDDILATFADEKAATIDTEASQTSSTAMPGWGGWVGAGLVKRDRAQAATQAKRAPVRTTAGMDPARRRDAASGMQRVMVSEARVKKNDRFLATSLPFPFETKAQYERSLRLPVGPEWTTKETFQAATKPRIMIKQGIIAPMVRPMI